MNPESGEGEDTDLQGSRLSQRIKRSYERSTGLREVATTSGPSTAEATQTPSQADEGDNNEEGTEEPDQEGTSGDPPYTYPEEEDDELEREMLAAFEDGDYDPKAEEDIAAENG